MAGKAAKKEKPSAVYCVCGAEPCYVKARQGKMVCCPNTLACAMRGRWQKSLDAAIIDWNAAVAAAKAK